MTISTKTWFKENKLIVNRHYLQKRLNIRFLTGVINKILLEKKNKEQPWLTFDSVKILKGWIKPNDVILEFGSGQSTRWFAKISHNITSVEHDKDWYNTTKNSLINIASKTKLVLGINKNDYLKITNNFPDNSIDICLIDGEWRRDCMIEVFKKIKVGGMIILDNAETYLPIMWPSISFQDSWKDCGSPEKNKIKIIENELKKWRIISTSDVSQDTVFFIKKSD